MAEFNLCKQNWNISSNSEKGLEMSEPMAWKCKFPSRFYDYKLNSSTGGKQFSLLAYGLRFIIIS